MQAPSAASSHPAATASDPQRAISAQVPPGAAPKPPGPVSEAQPITGVPREHPWQSRTPPRGTGGAKLAGLLPAQDFQPIRCSILAQKEKGHGP